MKKTWLIRIGVLVVVVILILSILAGPLVAQQRPPRPQSNPNAPKKIPEEEQSWPGFPWLAGGLLSGGAIMIGIKNARRSHRD
ncbi:MAG: hypothetical protein JW860_04395 [Sedimentisphaerales bacterium]|nr:hypothetical protein [Sedimentisphaerales bacterium]